MKNKWIRNILLAATIVLFVSPALRGENEPKHELTSADVEAFFDGLIPVGIERSDIAGCVVAVVKDGNVIFAKGYGYSDLAKKKPVSATDTLFRPGSVSKLFTWTAVMQQVEQGKLNLDHDVNEYLDFKIPATFPQPITLRHIMTHTAGFGETLRDLFIPDTKSLTPLRTYLVNHIPNRIFPPGTVPAYSNYATSLAGYIVERVSGKPFNQYVKENIYDPLQMNHTTFDQPLPPNLKPLMSDGYQLASSGAGPWEVVQAWPAGSVSTSAMDMTHFIIAHLNNGEYNGVRILREDTAKVMHSRQFGAHPATSGMCLGFYEETRNGHRIIGHAGDTYYFHSDTHLILDQNVGFFVSYNSGGSFEDNDRTALWHKFLDRYYPYTAPKPEKISNAAQEAATVSGLYISSRRVEGNLFEATGMMGETKIYVNADGTISSKDLKDFSGHPKKWKEISPLVFRDVNGQDLLAFKKDANGRLFFAMDWPFMTFQRVGLIQSKTFNYIVLGASVGILLLALLFWPVIGLIRRHYNFRLELTPKEKRLRVLTRLVCLIDLVFLGGLVGFLSTLESPGAINSSLNGTIHIVQIVGWIGAIGTIVLLYNWIVASKSSHTGWYKLFQLLIALSGIGITWFFLYWNLLNLTPNF